MAPRQIYEAYTQARKRPYLIHFAGYQKPWDVVDCDFAEYFWEYAKLSPYYPQIILELKERYSISKQGKKQGYMEKLMNNVELRKLANNFFPIGSRRRELIKKYFTKR